jgi:hypothetical protein
MPEVIVTGFLMKIILFLEGKVLRPIKEANGTLVEKPAPVIRQKRAKLYVSMGYYPTF